MYYNNSLLLLIMFLQARCCYVNQAGLELTLPEYWDLRYELLDLILLIIFWKHRYLRVNNYK